ncbi:hypothetical protein V5E97_00915 [Singulisphaera sp. Ch08]|uniref:Uncharacterized protein n=1 Tax=Singulisphaera sp. Ch08 TaxID=3120278 RepID=A0AAU7CHV3_9BACT
MRVHGGKEIQAVQSREVIRVRKALAPACAAQVQAWRWWLWHRRPVPLGPEEGRLPVPAAGPEPAQ